MRSRRLLGRNRGGQALAALRASPLQDRPPRFALHSLTEAVFAKSLDSARLIRPLHRCGSSLLAGLHTPRRRLAADRLCTILPCSRAELDAPCTDPVNARIRGPLTATSASESCLRIPTTERLLARPRIAASEASPREAAEINGRPTPLSMQQSCANRPPPSPTHDARRHELRRAETPHKARRVTLIRDAGDKANAFATGSLAGTLDDGPPDDVRRRAFGQVGCGSRTTGRSQA